MALHNFNMSIYAIFLCKQCGGFIQVDYTALQDHIQTAFQGRLGLNLAFGWTMYQICKFLNKKKLMHTACSVTL